jgi:hypothetical protein
MQGKAAGPLAHGAQHEVYVSCASRTVSLSLQFLDTFVPRRREVTDAYAVPELSDEPSVTFPDAPAVLRHLESERQAGYMLYWDRDDDGDPQPGDADVHRGWLDDRWTRDLVT